MNYDDLAAKYAEIFFELKTLRSETARLREALEFYADEESWFADYSAFNLGPVKTSYIGDGGAKAREALGDK